MAIQSREHPPFKQLAYTAYGKQPIELVREVSSDARENVKLVVSSRQGRGHPEFARRGKSDR